MKAPTHFVWGRRPLRAAGTRGELARLMPDASLVRVARAGHLPWLDDATAVRDAIERFASADA